MDLARLACTTQNANKTIIQPSKVKVFQAKVERSGSPPSLRLPIVSDSVSAPRFYSYHSERGPRGERRGDRIDGLGIQHHQFQAFLADDPRPEGDAASRSAVVLPIDDAP